MGVLMKKLLFIPIILLWFCSIGWADTHNCVADCGTTCSSTSVQNVLNNASFVTGDVLSIPAGSCTWTGTASIPSSKKVIIQGAGKTSTVITSSSSTALKMNESGSRLTQMGFIQTGSAVQIDVQGVGWRIDNCKFENTTGGSVITIDVNGTNVSSTPYGLIDNNEFIQSRIITERVSNITEARAIWSQNSPFGTANNVYIEDNTFLKTVSPSNGNVIDAETSSGSYVARYNTVNSSEMQIHGWYRFNSRGPNGWEIYRNTFVNEDDGWIPILIRGGTGFAFGNTASGYDDNRIALSMTDRTSTTWEVGVCDGTKAWDGNEGPGGYPCRDQIGRGKDVSLATDEDPYPAQVLEPVYTWLNRTGASIMPVFEHSGGTYISPNVDYYDEDSTHCPANPAGSCTQGVGSGTLANRPASCTIGVGYWATDQGSWNNKEGEDQGVLYKCVSNNTWALYYTPYQYPHPLRTESEPPADTTDPAFSTASINSVGTTLSITLTEDVTVNTNTGFTLHGCSGGAANLTYVSEASGVLSYTIARAIQQSETGCHLDYTTGADYIEDAAGNDLDTFADGTVVNNSQQNTPPAVTLTISSHTGATAIATPSGTDATINCGSTCSASYDNGTSVVVQGSCLANYQNMVIGGDCAPTTGEVTVTGEEGVSCTVTCTKIAADNRVGTGNPGHKVGAGNPAHKRY
jgi:hypothetical protein